MLVMWAMDSIKARKVYPTDEADEALAKEYGGCDMEDLIGSNA